MDGMGGGTLATYDMAHLLANDPAYMGCTLKGAPTIKDFQAAIKAACADVSTALQAACGKGQTHRRDKRQYSSRNTTRASTSAGTIQSPGHRHAEFYQR